MATSEAAIAALLDREEIRSLALRYCHYVWEGDADAYASLFTEDAEITERGCGIDMTITGVAAIRSLIVDAASNRKPRPLLHNHVIDLRSDTHATGSSHVEVLDGTVDYAKSSTAYYRDEYVKVDGQWRFRRRDLTFVAISAAAASRIGSRQ
jgi:ketosteroid isomerase-like protein